MRVRKDYLKMQFRPPVPPHPLDSRLRENDGRGLKTEKALLGSGAGVGLVGPVLKSIAVRVQADTQAEHTGMSAEQGILKKVRGCVPIALPEADAVQPKYVSAIENSTLARWCLAHGETIAIPKLSEVRQRPLVRVIDQISAAKATDPAADTGKLVEQLDWLVYDLYDLTNEETAAVADFFWDGTLTDEEEDQALLRAMEEADINDRVSLAEVLKTLRTPDDC